MKMKENEREQRRPWVASSASVCHRHHFCHACTSQLLGVSYSREKLIQRAEQQRAVSIGAMLEGAHYSSLGQHRKTVKNFMAQEITWLERSLEQFHL